MSIYYICIMSSHNLIYFIDLKHKFLSIYVIKLCDFEKIAIIITN
jgi:hypothetical protein